jgi:hypothetical protein
VHPLFTKPDSPLSGVLAFVLTLPWSVHIGIPIGILKPDLVSDRTGILSFLAVYAALNAGLIVWIGSRRRMNKEYEA